MKKIFFYSLLVCVAILVILAIYHKDTEFLLFGALLMIIIPHLKPDKKPS